MDNDDGGPAFPVTNDSTGEQYSGMSLRDFFAAKAMVGMLAASYSKPNHNFGRNSADKAYRIADAMLEAREAES